MNAAVQPLVFAAGVIATVTAVQRQRPRWAAVFILLLVVCSFDPYLINYLLSVIYLDFVLLHLGDIGAVLSQLMAPTALAVLILVFTFTRGTESPLPGLKAHQARGRPWS